MVGIPDGLGARNSATTGKFELFMSHELSPGTGVVRAHGQNGAFVSKYSIDKATLAIDSGADLVGHGDLSYWNYPAGTFSPTPSPAGGPFAAQGAQFNRFCSATLTDPGQLLNEISGNGYSGQIYFGNEEGGGESRSFGILADDGTTKQSATPRPILLGEHGPGAQPRHDARPGPGGRCHGPDLELRRHEDERRRRVRSRGPDERHEPRRRPPRRGGRQ